MTWSANPQHNRALDQGEVAKIRWEVLGYCQGQGLDVGCGSWKIFPSAIGIDNGVGPDGAPTHRANLAGNGAKLELFADHYFDYVFSAHCLEDIADYQGALAEWWRVLKVGGRLVLYLPHADLYPRRGQPGANTAHRHDFLPADLVAAMQTCAPDWTLVEDQVRDGADEYSFLQVYVKGAPGSGQAVRLEETDPAKRCIVIRYGGYGDVLVAGSTFPHLKVEGWHLTVYTGEKGAEVLRHDPHVDRVVVFDILGLNTGTFRALTRYLRGRCARFINFSETFEGLLLASPSRPSFYWPHAMRHRFMNANYLETAHAVAGVPPEYRQFYHASTDETAEAWAWRADMPRLVVLVASGSGLNKIWPGMFEYAWRMVDRHPDLHVAVLGGTYGAQFVPHPRVHAIGETWPVRRALALAQVADLVIGPETGILNAVALEPMPKIVLLSHSSAQNLTQCWMNTAPLAGNVPCYPCHRLHRDWEGCVKDPATQFAACQSAIAPMAAVQLTEQLIRPARERAAA